MPDDVESFVHEYARRYSAQDVEGVTAMCRVPFLAIRGGQAIDMPDRNAVRDHFAARIDAYRAEGAGEWSPVEIEVREAGEHSAFASVRWNALDARGQVTRNTVTTYHLLREDGQWRFLSYTNHF